VEFRSLERLHVSRRALVRGLLLAGGMAPALLSAVRRAGAMSARPIVPGVQEFTGDFRLNGVPARRGQIVRQGDVATTGPGASAAIIVGEHAFLLRENSRIEFFPVYFEQDGVVSGTLKVATGAMLSVFGPTRKTFVETPLAIVGIRGTACYVDSRPERTYACVCYGIGELSNAARRLLETVETTHHDAPRYIYPPGAPAAIETAPVIDHTDAELRLLESLVNRWPPFDEPDNQESDRY